MSDLHRRIAAKQDRVDGIPPHGIERYEHHACRCDTCQAAHVRVERLAYFLDQELRRRYGAT